MAKTPRTLMDAIRYFADDDVSRDFLAELRWPDGVRCPTCGSEDVRFIGTRKLWECKTKHRRKQFSIKVGTIFEDSAISLDKWLAAIWMIANDKNGVSSYELHRALGVTQKSAWYMLHRIRLAMQTKTFDKMDGEVEVDETWIGGKARNMHKTRRAAMKGKAHGFINKAIVFGLLERDGAKGHSTVRAQVVPTNRRSSLFPIIREHVSQDAEVFSDAHPSYYALTPEYMHEVIDHAESYVRGKVHTNGLENFWSLLKRAIAGTYVSVEPFHLLRYLDEQVFRYNEREDDDAGRFVRVLRGIIGKRLTYAELTSAEPATTPA